MSIVINNPSVRRMTAQAELYEGSNLITTFSERDNIKSIEIQRVGEDNKFFGFGICQKLKLHLVDAKRELEITTENKIKVALDNNRYPIFTVTEVNRDENTNELSITGYDILYGANTVVVDDLDLEVPYTTKDFITAAATHLGISAVSLEFDETLNLTYQEGANFDGTEGLRLALNSAAEATACFYFIKEIDGVDTLIFRQPPNVEEYVITAKEYFTLKSGTNRRLSCLCSTTELGDNVQVSSGLTGTTQYLRNNPFLEMREDIGQVLDNIFNVVANMTINQFECDWRGCPQILDLGVRISLVTKEHGQVSALLYNDSIVYEGGLKEKTEWQFNPVNECETAANPTSLGEALLHTYARVDKVNKEIEMVASDSSQTSEKLAQIQMTTDNIISVVERIEKETGESIESLNGEIVELTKKVETQITAEDISFQIKQEMSNGTDKVMTSTGFTFDETGLTISKTGTEMSTVITEDGMTVYKDDEAMLVANNQGVIAHNLHADTYLIIGTYSRFEDFYNEKGARTGCFWIGG